MPVASSLDANDVLHISQGGVDKQLPAATFLGQVNGGNPFNVIPVDEGDTTKLITLNDKDKFIQCINVAGCTITIPTHANAPFPVGSQFTVKNDSTAGIVSFTAQAGVTIRQSTVGLSLETQGQAATLVKVGADTWNMIAGGGEASTLNGDTASRPVAGLYTGLMYFDTDLGYPVWYDGTGWVDATGTTA